MELEEKQQIDTDDDAHCSDFEASSELDKDSSQQEDARFLDRLHCPACLRTFHDGNRPYYERHLKTCGKGNFSCSICNKNFCSPKVLKRHHVNVHLKLKISKCDICSREFTTTFNFKRHLERAHGPKDTEVHHCHYCSKEFKWKSSLSRHVIEKHCVQETAFECVCGQKFHKYHQVYVHKKSCKKSLKKNAENEISVEKGTVYEDVCNHENKTLEIENVHGSREMSKNCAEMLGKFETKVDSVNVKQTGFGHHKCQFCNQIFIERQLLEDHIEKCDPYDHAIEKLYSNMGKGEKQISKTLSKNFSFDEVKCFREIVLTENELEVAKEEKLMNIEETEKIKENTDRAVVVIDLNEISRHENQTVSDVKKINHQSFCVAGKVITNALNSYESMAKKNVTGKQKTDIDIDCNFSDNDPDFFAKETCSRNVTYRSRSGRKRKLKVFEDYETDYLDSLKPAKRCIKSADNSDQNITIKSENKNYISQDADSKSGIGKEREVVLAKADGRKSTSVTFLCPLCDKTDEDLDTIQDHIRNNHDQKRLSWVVLSLQYKKMQEIDKDPAASVKHGKTMCSSCKVDYHSTKQLKSHMNKHHAYYPFCCGICRLAHDTIEAAKTHMRKIHLQGFACLQCPKSFLRKKTLLQHCNKYHRGKTKLTESDRVKVVFEKGKTGQSIGSAKEDSKDTFSEEAVQQTIECEVSEEIKGKCKIVTVGGNLEERVNQEENSETSKLSEHIVEESINRNNLETRITEKKKGLTEDNKSLKTNTVNERNSVEIKKEKNHGNSEMSKQRVESSNIKNSVVIENSDSKGRISKDEINEGKEMSEQQYKEQKIIQKEIPASSIKINITAQGKQMAIQSPVVIKSVKIVPRNVFSKYSKVSMVLKEKESIRKQELQERNKKNDTPDIVDANTEYFDFDANISDTDEDVDDDDDDTNLKQSELKYKHKKKMAFKQQKTQMLFDFSALRDVVFKCSFEHCGDVLPSFDAWQNHLVKHTKKRRRPPFKCMECSYSTQDKKILNQHLVIKHNGLETVEIALKYCQVLHRETGVPLKVIACVFCGFLNDLEHFSSQHRCYRKRLNFYCPFCPKKDSIFESLQDHMKGEHPDKKIHRQEMGDKYQSLRKSQQDPASGINEFDKECKKCEQKFERNGELKIHVNEKHAIFPYSCGVCRQCYGRRTAVMDHMKKTHSLPLVCRHCERGFGDKTDLSRHEASHQKTKPFKCDLCESRYADQKGLRTHYRQKHPEKSEGGFNMQRVDDDMEPEVFMCDVCGLSFDSCSQYKKHIQTHNDDDADELPKITCDICSKAFTRKAYSRHLCTKMLEGNGPVIIEGYSDSVESIQNIFQKIRQSPTSGSGAKVRCGLCHKDFNKNKYMYNHIRQVHLPNEGKKLHCSICKSGFNGKAQLMSHMRSHSNVKPYKCRICSKSYRQLGHVRVHLLSHSKKPNFKCKLCSQAFKAKCTLSNHVLTHCDIFPYKCFVSSCKNAFNSLQNLLVHVRQCGSNSKTAVGFECKICSNKIDSLKNGLSHMKFHGKDPLYKCNQCFQDFMSYRKLYNHKEEVNHFSQSELERAASKSTCVQTFKCVEVDEDLETLQRLYDYMPEDFAVENSNSETKHDFEDVEHIYYTDTEETEVGNVVETEELMDIAEQLTHMATREEKRCVLPQVQADLPAYGVNMIIGTPVQTPAPAITYANGVLNDNFTAINSNMYLNEELIEQHNTNRLRYVNTHTESRKMTDLNMEQRENSHMSDQTTNFFATEESNLQVKILGSQPVIDENAVIVATESPVRKRLENSLNKQAEELQEKTQETPVEMQYEDQIGTNVISEEMLTSSKIFDEFGKEVKVNFVNDKGYHVPVQSNPELLQTLLSTGKYTLQFTHSESSLEEYSQAVPDLKENSAAASQTEMLPKVSNVTDFENLDFNLNSGTDIYVINEMPTVEEYRYADGMDVRFETEEKTKKLKPDLGQKKRKLMNIDKVFGEIVDKEAEIGNCKMEEGQINYKVRLHYYEDRTKQEEQYPLKCDVCSYRFRRIKDLNLHKKRHLPNDAKPFQCKECGKGYTTRHTFMAHMLTHTGERPHKCDQCEKSFRQLGHLQTHLRRHANYRPFKCRHCDKTFVTNSQLKQHVQSHGTHFQQTFENGIACLVCGNVFANEKDLSSHKLKHLSSSAQNELLGDFNMLMPDKSQNKSNKKVKIVMQGKVMCDVCGKMFNRPSDLKDHKAVHYTGPKLPCKECGNEFISDRRLQSHINNVHSVERWQCDTCGLQLKSKLSFKCHVRSHKEPQFQCIHCKKTFVRKYTFLQHLPSCLGNDFVQKVQNLTDEALNTGAS